MMSSSSSVSNKEEYVYRSKIEGEVLDICFYQIIEAEEDTDSSEEDEEDTGSDHRQQSPLNVEEDSDMDNMITWDMFSPEELEEELQELFLNDHLGYSNWTIAEATGGRLTEKENPEPFTEEEWLKYFGIRWLNGYPGTWDETY